MRRRNCPDGLPFRVYERRGKRIYSIGYKLKSGRWAFRYVCSIVDAVQIAKLRRKAIEQSLKVEDQILEGSFAALVSAWFDWQDKLPLNDARKRAASTLSENRSESVNIIKAFGHIEPSEISKTDGYAYLEACLYATYRNKNGEVISRPRPEKGNKEIALARLVLEFGIKRRMLETNPFDGLEKNRTVKAKRLVTPGEMNLAVEQGRKLGGSRHIVALALRTAWLCLRRSVEVRAVTRDCIKEAGILWDDGKDPNKPKILIEWSPELRKTIDEALAIKRNHVAGSMYIFGNMRGQRYTKGGWKSMLDDLMRECVKVAKEKGIEFKRFSLQDCRPMGVTDKLKRGDTDIRAATDHSSQKMIDAVYDRRLEKRATPAG